MKLCTILFSLALATVAFAAASESTVAPPSFPDTFTVKGIFQIPYFNITEPFVASIDKANHRQYFSYYGGMDQYTYDGEHHVQYMQFPTVHTKQCFKLPYLSQAITPVIPDLSVGWTYAGQEVMRGKVCDVWSNVSVQLNYTNTYKMFIDEFGSPVRLNLQGYDFVWGSHPDHYILDYVLYAPNKIPEGTFDAPAACGNASDLPAQLERSLVASTYNRHRRALAFTHLTNPAAHLSSDSSSRFNVFRKFVQQHGKQYPHALALLDAFANHEAHAEYVQARRHLNPDSSFDVELNPTADMSHEQFLRQVLPKVFRPHENNGADSFHVPTAPEDLPASVDWRLNGSVTMVKDQGVCGSCWTFGSTGSLEGMWQIKTGRLISLAEQQIVDCAWGKIPGAQNNSVMGCGGGFASAAFSYIKENGGIGTEESYHYIMKNGWCKQDLSSGVSVTGYVNVTSGSESALQSAVATAGPTAVAIDASHPSFRFYKSGVYYEPACLNGVNDLDHEVLAIGYGVNNGQDYWWVKNSWSTYWGMQGYVQMSRNKGNNCGIATQPTYPLV